MRRTKLRDLSPARRKLQTLSSELAFQPHSVPWWIIVLTLGIMAISVYGVQFMSAPATAASDNVVSNFIQSEPSPLEREEATVAPAPEVKETRGKPYCVLGQLVDIIEFRRPRPGQDREVPELYQTLVSELPQIEVRYRELNYRETVFLHTADGVLVGPKLDAARRDEQPMCLVMDGSKRHKIGVFLRPEYR